MGKWSRPETTYVRVRGIDHDTVKLDPMLLGTSNSELKRFGSGSVVKVDGDWDTRSMRARVSYFVMKGNAWTPTPTHLAEHSRLNTRAEAYQVVLEKDESHESAGNTRVKRGLQINTETKVGYSSIFQRDGEQLQNGGRLCSFGSADKSNGRARVIAIISSSLQALSSFASVYPL